MIDALSPDGDSAAPRPVEIRSTVQLPAERIDVDLHTADGLTLVGELALPVGRAPVATLLTLHPLPTAGGFMDSHILRKASARLPALAGIAVLRFNFRGTSSPRGRSEGAFGEGDAERLDLEAALALIAAQGLPTPWLVGWSFGTEVALKHGLGPVEAAHSSEPGAAALDIAGAILLSPPLHRTSSAELARWHDSGKPVVALIPEFDDFLRPEEAARKFAVVPEAELVVVQGGKHLWVGENQTRRVLDEIVRVVAPDVAVPLPETWPTP